VVALKKRTTPLTKDELFAAALTIADTEGLEALSMRRLAAEVGVEAASLYHHLPNKDALLDGILVRMRSEMRLPDPLPQDWKDAAARNLRRVSACTVGPAPTSPPLQAGVRRPTRTAAWCS